MSTCTDIPVLYREFTDSLTEVLAEPQAPRHTVADLQGPALPSKGSHQDAVIRAIFI